MAKIKLGILGPVSGKIGPVVGGVWKETAYLRKVPVLSTKKRTVAQIANEMKFKFIMQWLSPLSPFITVGFNRLATNKTESNVAYQLNLPAITGTWPDLVIDYSKVIVSKGLLPVLNDPEIILAEANTVFLTWKKSGAAKARYNDQVVLLLYCPELGFADGIIGGVKRADESCTYIFHEKLVGKQLEVYVSITSASRKMVSDSFYLGTL